MANKLSIRKLIAVTVFITVCAVLILQMSRFYRRDYFGAAAAVWNAEQAYIFVQRNRTVEKVPAWSLILAKLFGVSQSGEFQTRRDLFVFHVRDRSIVNHVQEDFDLTGQLVVFRDTPYLITGGYNIEGFQWAQDHFSKLEPAGLNELRRLLLDVRDPVLSIGWRKSDWEGMGKIGDDFDQTFRLNGFSANAEIRVVQGPTQYGGTGHMISNPSIAVTLSIDGLDTNLLALSQNYKPISAREFREARKVGSKP